MTRAITAMLALLLTGCSVGVSLQSIRVDLLPGETYDGTHGLCKWGAQQTIVWGEPHGTDTGSPYGDAHACYAVDDLPVRTPDGAVITEASYPAITVVYCER